MYGAPSDGLVALVLGAVFVVLALFVRSRLAAEEREEGGAPARENLAAEWFEAVEWEVPTPDTPRRSFYRPVAWTVLIDTGEEERYSDHDLRYLAAVLGNEGIPAMFTPWEPGGHFGFVGPQYPTRLVVDEACRAYAAAVLADLFPEGYRGGWQVRVVDPLLDVYGRREAFAAYARLSQLASSGDRGWRAAVWLLLLFMVLGGVAG